MTKERLRHEKTNSETENDFRKSPGDCITAPHLETNLLIEGFAGKSYGNAGLRGK